MFRDRWLNLKVALTAAAIAVSFAVGVLLHTVAQNTDRSISTKNLAEQLQRERMLECESLNARNRETKRRLDLLITELPAGERKRARESSRGTRLLIDALAPVRDCSHLNGR